VAAASRILLVTTAGLICWFVLYCAL
jgi:hypothetical protein